MRRQLVRGIASTAALSLVVTLAPATPAMAAPDAAATTVKGLLTQLAGWTDGLDEVAGLADKVPLLGVSPDSVLDLDQLVDDAFDAVDLDQPLSSVAGTYPFGSGDQVVVSHSTLPDGRQRVLLRLEVEETVDAPFGLDSSSPKVSLTTPGGVSTSVQLVAEIPVVYELVEGVHSAYVEVAGGLPSITVGVDGAVPVGTTLDATVGILEVDVATVERPLAVAVDLAGSVSDPDGDGRLYFTKPNGSPGELAAPGSVTGLVDVGFADQPGSATGTFDVTATPAASLGLPGIDARVTLDWTTISDPATLTVGATGFTAVQDFLNLTLRDVADGLGQLTALIEGVQRARFGSTGNLDLPFMRGTLADALAVNETLVQFLRETVYQADENQALAGQPKWSSLQDLIAELDDRTFGTDIAGAELDVSVGTYDPAAKKLPLTLSLSREAPAAEPLYDPETAFSGPTAVYSDTGLSLPGTPFQDSSGAVVNLAGRRIVAGTSSGTIAALPANTANQLALEGGWSGGTPAPGTPWSITGADVQTGLVELGNVLAEQPGVPTSKKLSEANALAPVATVRPSYDATVALLLDLSPAVPQDPPVPIENPDGTIAYAAELPIGPDRVLVVPDQTSFTASLPITTTIDTLANVGYVRVRVGGTLAVCHPSAGADCAGTPAAGSDMLSIALKGTQPRTFGQLFDLLSDTGAGDTTKPADLVDVTVQAAAYASGSVSVPDAPAFLGSLSAGFSIACADLLQAPGSCAVSTTDLSELFDLDIETDNPQALLGVLIKVLEALDAGLLGGSLSGPLATKIPLLGVSVKDLLGTTESGGGEGVSFANDGTLDGVTGRGTLTDTVHGDFSPDLVGRSVAVGTVVGVVGKVEGSTLTFTQPWPAVPAAKATYAFRTEIRDTIDALVASPPDALQDALALVNDQLPGGLAFRYAELTGTGAGPHLVLDLEYEKSYTATRPVRLDFSTSPTDDFTLIGLRGNGSVGIDVQGSIDLGLAVPLVAGDGPPSPADLKVLADSSVDLGVAATANGTLTGSIGPLSLSLGKPGDESQQIDLAADVDVALTGGGAADAATPFTSFLSGVGVEVSSDGASCAAGADVADSVTLAVCGSAPVFTSIDGVTWEPISATQNTFAIRLPAPAAGSGTAGLADLLDLSGAALPAQGGGTVPRLQTPDVDLAALLQVTPLNFDNLLEGINEYLTLIEQGLRLASANGTLPLVGEDLQQGADFVGTIRTEFNDKIASKATVGALRTAVNDELAAALPIPNGSIVLDVACGVLGTAAAPDVTTTPETPPAGATWSYAVVAYSGDATTGRTFRGDASAGVSNAATLDGTNFNSVSWAPVQFATGYLVLRQKDGGDWRTVADVTGTTYDDKDSTTDDGAAPADPAEAPKVSCPDDAPLTAVESVKLALDIQQGDPTASGCTGDCLTETVPIDIGIPGLALRADRQGDQAAGLSLKLGYAIHFAVELNRDDGFVVLTGDQAQPELRLGVAVGLEQPAGSPLPPALTAELAVLQIEIRKNAGSGADEFAGLFSVDITGSGGGNTLTIADLLSDPGAYVVPKLQANVDIDWALKAMVDSALPGISANLVITWGWTTADDPGDTTDLYIAFNDVAVDVGAFFSDVLGPIVNEIKRVTTPLKPVLDTLYAPLPVLSQLAGQDVTLVTLAEAFSTLAGGPDLTFVRKALDVIKLVTDIADGVISNGDGLSVPIGSFTIAGQKALDAPATPDRAVDLLAGTPDPGDKRSEFVTSNPQKPLEPGGAADKAGFAFPVIEQPLKLFGLLLNQDVDIVTWDSGPLELAFTWKQSFGPVYAPPPVMVTLSGSAGVKARILAGFDTFGIRKAFELGRFEAATVPNAILEGLYLGTNDPVTGQRVAVLELYGQIAAGASVSAVVIEVGIQGGIRLTVSFYWRDPNNDGKFRISEFVNVALNNPICLFTVGGRLSLFIKVFITLGISPFSVTFDFTLVDVTLLDFEVQADCEPPPPKLGDVDGTILYVFAGRLGNNDLRGAPWGNNGDAKPEVETFKIYSMHYREDGPEPDPDFDGFLVEALGESQEFLVADHPGLDTVVVDGRDSSIPMKMTFLGDGDKATATTGVPPEAKEFDQKAVVIGSSDKDNIRTGVGPAWIDSRGGDDVVQTAQRPGSKVVVAGGGGSDSLTLIGDGDAVAAGDSALDLSGALGDRTLDGRDAPKAFSVVTNLPAIGEPGFAEVDATDGNDRIGLGLGENTAYGNGGADSIGIATGKNAGTAKKQYLVGGTGPDSISGGDADDTIFTALPLEFAPDAAGSGDPIDPPGNMNPSTNTVQTGRGNDVVWGGDGIDLVESSSLGAAEGGTPQKAKIYGGGNEDVLSGGFGADEVYGGPDDDYVLAEPSVVGPVTGAGPFGPIRTVERKPLPGDVVPSRDRLVGGTGDDHVVGGDGGADVWGDKYLQASEGLCRAGSPVRSDPIAETPDAADGRDDIIGGIGVDVVSAGGNDDRMRLAAGDDLGCGQAGNDEMRGGGDADGLWGGTGADQVFGDAGTDEVYGNDGEDTLWGGSEADVLEGNAGADTADGGSGPDLVIGGTRAAGRADVGDTLYGGTGTDTLVGDNARHPGTGPAGSASPFDLEVAAEPSPLGAGDAIFGGEDDDAAYGGLGGDLVDGGPQDDHLEGNNGADTVLGGAGEDELVGGSFEETAPLSGTGRPDSGDRIEGGPGQDVVVGDNAVVDTVLPASTNPLLRGRGFATGHSVRLLDVGDTPVAGTSGADLVLAGDGNDVVLGQSGPDRLLGEVGDDLVEGGPGADWIEGGSGEDDLVGGSSTPLGGSAPGTGTTESSGQPDGADTVWGGPGEDTVLGDNATVLRGPGITANSVFERVGSSQPGTVMLPREVRLHDLGDGQATPAASRFAGDWLSGGSGVDVLWGQDGDDAVSGGAGDDYLEGNGGADSMRGDRSLAEASDNPGFTVPPAPVAAWPAHPVPAPEVLEGVGEDGQDDLIGGSSLQRFRDGDDLVEGNGAGDMVLGDNGTLLRVVSGLAGSAVEAVDSARHPVGAVPADAFRLRVGDPDVAGYNGTTRFCDAALPACEPTWAAGRDTLWGDTGDDRLWGQDYSDTIYGEEGHDDVFGELDDGVVDPLAVGDRLFGGPGEDAILGDRGGVLGEHVDAQDGLTFTRTLSAIPQETYTGLPVGTLNRATDLLADTDGTQWVGSDTEPVAHPGLLEGGRDRIRGGDGRDSIHAGWGDDLANGDAGGDEVFGGDGADVLWGGRGCVEAECVGGYQGYRGVSDEFVDHVFGGRGGQDATSDDVLRSDILDWNPRGSTVTPGTTCVSGIWPVTTGSKKTAVTTDPCEWFAMTDKVDGDGLLDQHHHGTDWIYGGWDRDVMQGNESANGPSSQEDRLIDWNGAFNLYTHCNAAYGGWNDIRQHSPAMNQFLTGLAYGAGAGRDASDVTRATSSAYRELAYVYSSDINPHGSGPAYPSTPGHFDDEVIQPCPS